MLFGAALFVVCFYGVVASSASRATAAGYGYSVETFSATESGVLLDPITTSSTPEPAEVSMPSSEYSFVDVSNVEQGHLVRFFIKGFSKGDMICPNSATPSINELKIYFDLLLEGTNTLTSSDDICNLKSSSTQVSVGVKQIHSADP